MTLVAYLHPYAAALILALTVGLSLVALGPLIPGRDQPPALVNLGLSWVVAWWLVDQRVALWWLPLAVFLGVLMHLAGDWPTTGQLPVPFTRRGPRFGPRLFDVGQWQEKVVRLVCVVAFVFVTVNGKAIL